MRFLQTHLTLPSVLRAYGMFRGFCYFSSGTMPGSITDMTILPETVWGGKRDFRAA